ncbi:unnamed protein product [Boreogadus saida]
MWRKYPTSDEIGISLIRGLWPDAVPHNMDAAYENVEMNQLLFFKGFPRNISDLGFPPRVQAVDAALHFRFAHLFTECWRYDEQQKTMEEGSPAPIDQQWPGVPSHLDAAIFYKGNTCATCGASGSMSTGRLPGNDGSLRLQGTATQNHHSGG